MGAEDTVDADKTGAPVAPEVTAAPDPDATADAPPPDSDATAPGPAPESTAEAGGSAPDAAFTPNVSAGKGNHDETEDAWEHPESAASAARRHVTHGPLPGDRIGDFELMRILGEGAFARVFLARQISLNRLVALKLSANRGNEARTMASLEHDHIVHVFLETVLPDRDLRLLCMQYVPGCTLFDLIEVLEKSRATGWEGRTLLEIVDARTLNPPAMDPAALRDRDFLDDCDAVEAVCWMGARLAEALAYAHRSGVLHRDVKPANVLVNPYGRPMLADFNIAVEVASEGENGIGGTPSYMAPEHLEAFITPGGPERVDRRADIYGLGVVLFELLTGHTPFPRVHAGTDMRAYVRELIAHRRGDPPSARSVWGEVPTPLDLTLRRCLAPDPAQRFQEAQDLAQALVGCRELRAIEKELPPAWPFPTGALTRPFTYLALLIVAPQIVSSVVNIVYNQTQIVAELSPLQRSAFQQLVVWYNLGLYPVCIAMLVRVVRPVYLVWSALEAGEPVDPAEVDRARTLTLGWPYWITVVSCLGWLPGALFFPLGIHLLSDPVSLHTYSHFIVSVAISGMIAVTYSFFGTQFIALRVLYPMMWADTRNVRRKLKTELKDRGRVFVFKLLAGVIPLLGAILMVGGGPDLIGLQAYRVLVSMLILLGMVGFMAAVFAGDLLAETMALLVPKEKEKERMVKPAPPTP